MNAERWQRVKQLLDASILLDPAQRAAHLDSACGSDVELRAEVESLLAAHDQAGTNFLKNPAVNLQSSVPSPSARVGRRVGVYQIVGEIGHGGMGEVYRAVRADGQYTKEVAVKLVRGGFDTASVLERFRNERQILASLDHSNIARLLDGGTTEDGVPYLVMELVEGKPIDQYCNDNQLNVTERLRVFREVCGAVQYAHQRLVIHRDIKSTNILVTKDGVPKLLDFGIAKILSPDADAQSTLTQVMTPEFASPEQIRGEPITTASDVYSLGVVLYYLLTERSPYPALTRSPHELVRAVCESAPIRPSTAIPELEERAGRDARANRAAGAAGEGSPVKLRRRLAGDLDDIALMALRKEPQRRYVSVEQFSQDISRHLAGLPVSAAPDSLLYRYNKFVRRNRIGVAAAILIVVTAAIGVLATLRQARIATANEVRAEKRFMDVRKLANSLLFEIHDSIENLPGSIPARKLLVEKALQYLDSLAQESGSDPALQRELATAYKRVGDVQGYPFLANLGDTAGAIQSYRKGLAIEEVLVKNNPESIPDALTLAVLERRLAEMDSMNQNIVNAYAEGQRAVAIGEQLVAKHPGERKILEDLAKDYQTLAGIAGGNQTANLGDTAGALKLHRKVVDIAEQLSAAEPADPVLRRFLAGALMRFADQSSQTGNLHEALDNYLRARELLESLATPNNATSEIDLAGAYSSLASIQLARGDVATAEVNFRKTLEMLRPLSHSDPQNAGLTIDLGLAYLNVGDIESRTGHAEESAAALQTAQTIIDQLASTTPTAEVRAYQGLVRVVRGEASARAAQTDAAIHFYRDALAVYSKLSADDPGNVDSRSCLAATQDKLGEALLRKRDFTHAAAAFHSALDLAETPGNQSDSNAQRLYVIADSYADLGDAMRLEVSDQTSPQRIQNERQRQAQSFYEQSLATWQKVPEPGLVSPDGFDSTPPDVVTRKMESSRHASKPRSTLSAERLAH